MCHAIITSAKVPAQDEEASCRVRDNLEEMIIYSKAVLLLPESAAVSVLLGSIIKLLRLAALPFPNLYSNRRKSRALLWDSRSSRPDTIQP